MTNDPDFRAALPQAQSWIWTLLPASTNFVRTTNARLASELIKAGVNTEVATSHARFSQLTTAYRDGHMSSIRYFGQPDPSPVYSLDLGRKLARYAVASVWGVIAAASSPVWRWLLNIRGYSTREIGIGDRGRDTYPIYGPTPAPLRMGKGRAILSEHPGSNQQSVFDEALSAAERKLDTHLQLDSVNVQETGKLLARARNSRGTSLYVRVALGSAKPPLMSGHSSVRRIIGALDDGPVARAIIEPLCSIEAGLAFVTVEEAAQGEHPSASESKVWDQSVEFLAALWKVPTVSPARERDPGIKRAAGVIAHLCPEHRDKLTVIAESACEALAESSLGWGHGDFWIRNILARDGEISKVLDWETATSDSLPLMDLFDFIGHANPRLTGSPGPAFIKVLIPLLDHDGENMKYVTEYCQRTGTRCDRTSLSAYALAYWILRTARDIETVPDRKHLTGWIRDNISEPLAAIEDHRSLAAFTDRRNRIVEKA